MQNKVFDIIRATKVRLDGQEIYGTEKFVTADLTEAGDPTKLTKKFSTSSNPSE